MNITSLLGEIDPVSPLAFTIGAIVAGLVLIVFLPRLIGVVYIPHTMIGVIEKIWSRHGSLKEGQIIARQGEAGFQTRLLRGGLHFGLYPWQYKVHKTPLVVVGEGKMGYVYARDGQPLEPDQTLGCNVVCNHFQDAESFLRDRQLLHIHPADGFFGFQKRPQSGCERDFADLYVFRCADDDTVDACMGHWEC